MKKVAFSVILLCITTLHAFAQSKIFKEVNNEISSQTNAIVENGNLMGYLVFTSLERVSEDSFSYKITLMDESLNDIGVVNFNAPHLSLQAVSFEQDVLCMAYLKSNYEGQQFKRDGLARKAQKTESTSIFLQFMNLEGKILKTQEHPVDGILSQVYINSFRKPTGTVSLKHSIQLRNLPGKGFACFYGDKSVTNLMTFSTAGEKLWEKKINVNGTAQAFGLLASGHNAYLLVKKENLQQPPGGFELQGFNTDDNSSYPVFQLKDIHGRPLQVLGFDNDPVTGKPYLAGTILNDRKTNNLSTLGQYAKGPHCGVFTININGPSRNDMQQSYSYWSDGSQPGISTAGRFENNGTYAVLQEAFKDYQGNTHFAGTSFIRRTRWGSTASIILTAPTIVIPVFILSGTGGTLLKCKVTDAMMLKQTASGVLSFENTIDCENGNFNNSSYHISLAGTKGIYTVANSERKANYMIVKDTKQTIIYNVTEQKIMRTIPFKDGNSRTVVYPAKEGHIMVKEYNQKEKYTRISIEAI